MMYILTLHLENLDKTGA